MSTPDLLQHRHALAAQLGDVERVLSGRLHVRTARGGYTYLRPRPYRSGRSKYVPPALLDTVRRYVRCHEEVVAVLVEISTVNLELLRRGELP
jgi:hypothetical protein